MKQNSRYHRHRPVRGLFCEPTSTTIQRTKIPRRYTSSPSMSATQVHAAVSEQYKNITRSKGDSRNVSVVVGKREKKRKLQSMRINRRFVPALVRHVNNCAFTRETGRGGEAEQNVYFAVNK